MRLQILETEYVLDRSWRRAAKELGWSVVSMSSVFSGWVIAALEDSLLRKRLRFLSSDRHGSCRADRLAIDDQ